MCKYKRINQYIDAQFKTFTWKHKENSMKYFLFQRPVLNNIAPDEAKRGYVDICKDDLKESVLYLSYL